MPKEGTTLHNMLYDSINSDVNAQKLAGRMAVKEIATKGTAFPEIKNSARRKAADDRLIDTSIQGIKKAIDLSNK